MAISIFQMLILRTEQEIRYVHCLDSLIVPTGKFVCCENKFGVIIRYFKQAAIFSLFCLFRVDLLRHLNIDFSFCLTATKSISLSPVFPTLTVYPRRQSSKYTIFQGWKQRCLRYSREHCIARQHRPDRIFPAFSGFPSPVNHIWNSGEADMPFQLFQIAVNRFVVEGSPFCFQVICNGLGGKGVTDIAECVLYNTLQLVDLPNLISFYNIRKIVELYISRTIV